MEMKRSSTLAAEEGAPISHMSMASPGAGGSAGVGKEEGKADSHTLNVAPDTDSDGSADGSSQAPNQLSEVALAQRIFTIAVAGTGFLADSYDLFVIGLVRCRMCVL